MGTSNNGFGNVWSVIEQKRLLEQNEYEKNRSLDYRKKQGQFFTKLNLADEIVKYAYDIIGDTSISFLEPAFGFGSFYSALSRNGLFSIKKAIGIEKDDVVFEKSKSIWESDKRIKLYNNDFLEFELDEQVDLIITNPPYIRHQLIEQQKKLNYKNLVLNETGVKLSGLSGMYCYFILHAQKWLRENALACWLLPSEFMDVNYGLKVKEYLLNEVTLLKIHRFDPVDGLFPDAQVTSAVVWYKNEKSNFDYEIEFSYGGTHANPSISKKIKRTTLSKENKWTRFPQNEVRDYLNKSDVLGDYFDIKRGVATGDNKFFIVNDRIIDEYGLKKEYLQPILPSPRYLKTDEIKRNKFGYPINTENLFLINCSMDEENIKLHYPELWNYLNLGKEEVSKKYLCKMRKKWYFQENRESAPLLCTYMGRGNKSIRFIRNKTDAVATNSYLMLYPKDKLLRRVKKNPDCLDNIWSYLNSMDAHNINDEGRIYGGGLRKIEPKELKNVKFSFFENISNL